MAPCNACGLGEPCQGGQLGKGVSGAPQALTVCATPDARRAQPSLDRA